MPALLPPNGTPDLANTPPPGPIRSGRAATARQATAAGPAAREGGHSQAEEAAELAQTATRQPPAGPARIDTRSVLRRNACGDSACQPARLISHVTTALSDPVQEAQQVV